MQDITLAEIRKDACYATAQFGKNHLGDLEEHLPHRHCFDEFWGSLYHLNGHEDLEDPDRPTDPAFKKKYDPAWSHFWHVRCRPKMKGRSRSREWKPSTTRSPPNHSTISIDARKMANPFFLWHNSTRQHVFPPFEASLYGQSRAGREDIYGDALKEHDGHVGQLLDKLAETGLDKNTIVIYTSRQRCVSIHVASRWNYSFSRRQGHYLGRRRAGALLDPLAGSSGRARQQRDR